MPRVLMALLVVGCGGKPSVSFVPPSGDPSLVFTVEKQGKTSFVMGTCHLPIPLEDVVDVRHIESSRKVFVEAELDTLDPTKAMALLWVTDQSLSETLGRELFTGVSRRSVSIPAPMLEHFKPAMAYTTLGLDQLMTEEQRQALSTGSGKAILDGAVATHARESEVEVAPLETIEEQIEMIEAAIVPDFERAIFPTDAQLADINASQKALMELCYGTRLEEASEMFRENSERDRILLSERNVRWMEKLRPELEQGGAFVAVGSGHLVGPKGLLSMMAADGYRVRNVARPTPPTAPPDVPEQKRAEVALLPLEQRERIAEKTANALCADGQVVRTCFEPEPDVCFSRARRDVGLCVDAHFSSLEDVSEKANDAGYAGCVMSGFLGSAVVEGFRDHPSCAMMRMGMEAAGLETRIRE